MALQLTLCPECGRAAEVIDRFMLAGTDGLIEHARIQCITGRWFTTPVEKTALGGDPAPDGKRTTHPA